MVLDDGVGRFPSLVSELLERDLGRGVIGDHNGVGDIRSAERGADETVTPSATVFCRSLRTLSSSTCSDADMTHRSITFLLPSESADSATDTLLDLSASSIILSGIGDAFDGPASDSDMIVRGMRCKMKCCLISINGWKVVAPNKQNHTDCA